MSPAIAFSTSRSTPSSADVVVLGVFEDQPDSRPSDLDWTAVEARGFEGKAGQVQVVEGNGGTKRSTLTAVVGLGKSTELDANGLRRIGAAVARGMKKYATVAVPFLEDLPDSIDQGAAAQALVEGIVLGSYSFERYKSESKPSEIRKVVLVGGGGRAWNQAAIDGAAIADAVCWARDLVNEPGGSLTAVEFAKAVSAMAKRTGLKVTVHDEASIKRLKMGGLLGVNRGSSQPPRFVELSYEPAGRPSGTLALVGKGLTFDSGGLSIKPGQAMMTMKNDMGGGAAVVGAMAAIGAVKPNVRVRAFVPMTDNMLGADATRPGDVLRFRNGKTTEVLNTDAEGRLILADALVIAAESKPDAIVDLATLTGACLVALGPSIAGLMGNNDGFVDQVRAAADNAGERVWPLPLPADYKKQLDSSVADMKNIGGPFGGTITAGLFLQEFVDGTPWAHIDLAGPAFIDAEDGEHPKGATGFGVRLLVELARTFEKPVVDQASGNGAGSDASAKKAGGKKSAKKAAKSAKKSAKKAASVV